MKQERDELLDIITRMRPKRALVVGDAINDIYIFGHVDRMCPEAPVPVFIEDSRDTRDGGAANVTRQVRELAGAYSFYRTPVAAYKERYMVGAHMLLRKDRDMRPAPIDPVAAFKTATKGRKFDVIIVSDYAKGNVTEALMEAVYDLAAKQEVKVIVDPKQPWSLYSECDWLCPNESEWADGATPALAMGGRVLIKRGAKGLRVRQCGNYVDVPATAKHVFDVTGAGDTVVAVFALALTAEATPLQAAQLANLAAGYVVGEVGTAVCSRAKLIELVESS